MKSRNTHIIKAFHLIPQSLCRECRLLRNRNITGSAGRHHDRPNAVFFREASADHNLRFLKILISAAGRIQFCQQLLRLPALFLVNTRDQDRLLLPLFHCLHDSGDLSRSFSRAVDHFRRTLTQLPVGIQLRESQIIVSCCCKRLFLQLQNSVIHRQLSRRYFFQHFPYIFHV